MNMTTFLNEAGETVVSMFGTVAPVSIGQTLVFDANPSKTWIVTDVRTVIGIADKHNVPDTENFTGRPVFNTTVKMRVLLVKDDNGYHPIS